MALTGCVLQVIQPPSDTPAAIQRLAWLICSARGASKGAGNEKWLSRCSALRHRYLHRLELAADFSVGDLEPGRLCLSRCLSRLEPRPQPDFGCGRLAVVLRLSPRA